MGMESTYSVDPKDTRRFFEERAHKRAEMLAARFDAAWMDARAIIAMIEKDYAPQRIWQWGSLLNQKQFSEISDIDIAVEGISDTETFFELYGKALALTSFPLDLVDLARIEPAHADSIRGRGRLVYERT
jgi:predicted nucleotidyltransferase